MLLVHLESPPEFKVLLFLSITPAGSAYTNMSGFHAFPALQRRTHQALSSHGIHQFSARHPAKEKQRVFRGFVPSKSRWFGIFEGKQDRYQSSIFFSASCTGPKPQTTDFVTSCWRVIDNIYIYNVLFFTSQYRKKSTQVDTGLHHHPHLCFLHSVES